MKYHNQSGGNLKKYVTSNPGEDPACNPTWHKEMNSDLFQPLP